MAALQLIPILLELNRLGYRPNLRTGDVEVASPYIEQISPWGPIGRFVATRPIEAAYSLVQKGRVVVPQDSFAPWEFKYVLYMGLPF